MKPATVVVEPAVRSGDKRHHECLMLVSIEWKASIMGLAQMFAGAPKSAVAGSYVQVLGAFEEVALLSTEESSCLDDVLRLVGRRLCELLRSSRCSVYLRQQDGTFRGQVGIAAHRNIDVSVRKLVAGVSADRFTAEIVNTASPVIVENALSDPRPVKNIMRRWGVRSMLGVPLVVEGEVIGLIFVDDEDNARAYQEDDVRTAAAFGGLAALTVRQSWFQQRLRDNARVMEQQRTALSESSLVHNRVTKAVLDGAGIDEIVSTIASLLGLTAVLYTPDLAVLAWSGADGSASGECPTLTREQVALEDLQQALRTLDDGEASVMTRATRELGNRRLISALTVDRECVGYLALSESGNVFTHVHRRAIEQAAMALALSTLGIARREALKEKEKELYFSDLVYGRRDGGALAERADEFGVGVEDVHGVILLRYESPAVTRPRNPIDAAALVESELPVGMRLVTRLRLPDAELFLVATEPGQASTTPDDIETTLARVMSDMLDRLVDEMGVRFVVLSETVRELGGIAKICQHARQVAMLLTKGVEQPRVVSTRSFAMLRLIGQRTGLPGAVEYSQEVLAPIIAYDAAHATELEETLRIYVKHDANLRATARALDVHDNTVRYRLRKIREISGLASDRIESLVRVCVAFEVQELLDPAKPS